MWHDVTVIKSCVNLAAAHSLAVEPCKHAPGRWSVVAKMPDGERYELSCWATEEDAEKIRLKLRRKLNKRKG